MYLVIAEKPSVSQAIAKVLGAYKSENGYMQGRECIVSWCLGHLAEYVPPEAYDSRYRIWQFEDLPIIPEEWRLSVAKEKKKQFEVLRGLLRRSDFDYVVNACDAGREGELIFKWVYDLSNSRIPVKRLWISSMEDSAIRDGFQHLREGREYENLCNAAVSRAQADWLVGMNATRAFTTIYGKTFKVGRVQTPTLAMLVERQEKIDHFHKETYYRVNLEHKGLTFSSEKIADSMEADRLADLCYGKKAVVTDLKREMKKASPPKLYDLTSLQREANRYFGFTAKKTLDLLQELYEKKLITYPRTDSQFVTEDMWDTVSEMVAQLPSKYDFFYGVNSASNVHRVINNKKVTDHHAILPTKQGMKEDWKSLETEKRHLMYLIGQQVLQAVADDFTFEQTEITVECERHLFEAKGKRPVKMGFKGIAMAFAKNYEGIPSKKEEGDSEEKPLVLPNFFAVGTVMEPVTVEKTEHYTSPPKPYNEDTLLSAMETAGNKEFEKDTEKKGLGTPATRASIIEKLVSSRYASRKGKQIVATEDGKELISILPDYLKSASMTAEWENQLLGMEKGAVEKNDFMEGITNLISMMLNGCEAVPQDMRNRFNTRKVVGICPVCGGSVYEGKNNFYCSNRDCDFILWKENRYLESMRKKLTAKMAEELLKDGKTYVKDLYSAKKDRTFSANLVLGMKDGRVCFSLSFPEHDS